MLCLEISLALVRGTHLEAMLSSIQEGPELVHRLIDNAADNVHAAILQSVQNKTRIGRQHHHLYQGACGRSNFVATLLVQVMPRR
jgi:glucosamine 6-phosphate synthetase-like amidotransferase/phosphosugar isomerase protein